MDTPTSLPTPSAADIKQDLEIQKLAAEVRSLRRPYHAPAVILSIILAATTLGGFVLQWLRSDRDYALAQIKTERLELKFQKQELDETMMRQRAARFADLVPRNATLGDIRRQVDNAAASLQASSVTNVEVRLAQSTLHNVAVRLNELVVIGILSASPQSIRPGESTTLEWKAINATAVEITPNVGVVPSSGSMVVSPSKTTTYILTMSNQAGALGTESITVRVNE